LRIEIGQRALPRQAALIVHCCGWARSFWCA
jgi:hypothetical protein